MNSILDNTATEPTEYLSLMPENQRDAEALAKAKYNADAHIKNLTSRLDELRIDYLKERESNQNAAKLEELIARLEQPSSTPTSSAQPLAKEVREPTMNLDEEFDKRYKQYKVAEREQDNSSVVRTKLKERFGNNYSEAVKQQIDELGLSVEDFDAMARKSPAALFRTLGLDQPREGFQAPVRGQSSFGTKVQPKKTWSHWQALKKENPKLYHDPKTINEMTQAHLELGSEFEDGDYHRFGS